MQKSPPQNPRPTRFQPRLFLTPRYWPTWLGVAVLWLLSRLPFRWQMHLGTALGMLMYHLMARRRHIARVNIALCFPALNTSEQERLVRRSFRSMGLSVFETALCWWGTQTALRPLASVTGIEHLQQALTHGKGAILLSAHFTCLEIGGRLLAQQHPFAVMYKRHRNPLFEAVLKHSRETQFQRAISRHDVRGLMRALKDNLAVWYAPDQDFGPTQSVFAPFMGVPAATLNAPARLAKLSGAPVVPFFALRRADDSGYDLAIHPPLENFPSGDDVADATHVNQIIETQVRKAPEQYLWLHRRFKTRPAGEPGVYGRADKRRRTAP